MQKKKFRPIELSSTPVGGLFLMLLMLYKVRIHQTISSNAVESIQQFST